MKLTDKQAEALRALQCVYESSIYGMPAPAHIAVMNALERKGYVRKITVFVHCFGGPPRRADRWVITPDGKRAIERERKRAADEGPPVIVDSRQLSFRWNE